MTPTPSAREPQAIASLRAYLHNGGHHSGAPTPTALSLALDQLDGNLREVLDAYDALAAEREALVADASEWAGKAAIYHDAMQDAERERDALAVSLKGANERAEIVLNAKNAWADRARYLEFERDALRADAERLDWLQANATYYGTRLVWWEGEPYRIQTIDRDNDGLENIDVEGATLRDAIDTARALDQEARG